MIFPARFAITFCSCSQLFLVSSCYFASWCSPAVDIHSLLFHCHFRPFPLSTAVVTRSPFCRKSPVLHISINITLFCSYYLIYLSSAISDTKHLPNLSSCYTNNSPPTITLVLPVDTLLSPRSNFHNKQWIDTLIFPVMQMASSM